MNNLFDKIYCINLDRRTDRWTECENEFNKVGITVERFRACEGDNHPLAFNKSQYECLKKGLADGCKSFLILEDDIEFRNWEHLTEAVYELPENWDALWLGGNIIGCGGIEFRKPARHSKYLHALVDVWQTHAIAYSRAGAEWIVNNFPFHSDEYKVEGLTIYDEWLRVNLLPRGKSFIVSPQVAVQRPSFSDIWNCESDYSSLFERGNELLK